MRKILLLVQCLLVSSLGFSQEYFGTTTWGDGGPEIPYNTSADSDGNIYSTGLYSGTITVGNSVTWVGGNADGFLTKFDSQGNPVWVKSFGGFATDVAIDVALDANNNIYLTGYFQGAGPNSFDADPGPGVFQLSQPSPFLSRDCFIIKLDSNGDFVWAKQVSNPAGANVNEDAQTIDVDSAGNVYIGGSFVYADFDPSPTASNEIISTNGGSSPDGFLLKLDTDGNYVWVKTFGSTAIVEIESMDIDDNDNIFISGRFRNTVDLDPNAGVAEFTSNGGEDIFVARLDVDGNYIWGQAIGGSGLDIASTIKNLSSGLYVGGMFAGTVDLDPTAGDNTQTSNGPWDAFVTKLDIDGNYSYSYHFGGEGTEFENVYNVTERPNGNLVLSGAFNGTTDFDVSGNDAIVTSNGNSDNYILEITNDGDYVEHWTIGGTHTEQSTQVVVNAANEFLTIGAFRSNDMDFDPFAGVDLISTNGFYDAYVSRFSTFTSANDACTDAIALACGDVFVGETINDTDSGGNAAPDEFFSYTGNGDTELVTFSLCDGGTDYDSVLRVYEDCTLTNEIATNDDFCGLQSEVSFLSDGTSTYYIMVEGFGTNAGNFSLEVSCLTPEANDQCEDAIAISCGETLVGSTVNATLDANAPVCVTSITAPGVWYVFDDTSGLVTDYTLSLCDGGTDYDSKLTVYSGDCGALVCEIDNDDSCGLQSEVSFQGDGNTTYYILVHGFGANTGNFSLNLDCTPVPPENDLIVNSIDIDEMGCPFTDVAVPMPAATTEVGSPTGCDINGANGVWYNYTPDSDGFITGTISNPAGFSAITFYEAPNENASVSELTLVDYFDNQCVPGTTTTIPVVAGQAYYAFVVNTGAITDIVFECNTLGVNDNLIEGFSFFPNPTTSTLNISAVKNIEQATIFNILGQIVIDQPIDSNTGTINMSNLTEGTYILKVLVDGQVGTFKVLKK